MYKWGLGGLRWLKKPIHHQRCAMGPSASKDKPKIFGGGRRVFCANFMFRPLPNPKPYPMCVGLALFRPILLRHTGQLLLKGQNISSVATTTATAAAAAFVGTNEVRNAKISAASRRRIRRHGQSCCKDVEQETGKKNSIIKAVTE